MPSETPKHLSDVPATAQTIAMTELDAAGSLANAPALALPAAAGDLVHALRNVKVRVMVCVGSAELTLGELLGAKAQQVVRLDRAVEQPVDVVVEGQVVARGTLVAVDERFGVRITELPVALAGPANRS
jgi:flagellar motor switch protein FliN/FliY